AIVDAIYYPPHGSRRNLALEIAGLILSYEDYLMDMRCLAKTRDDREMPDLSGIPISFAIFSKPASLVLTRTSAWQIVSVGAATAELVQMKTTKRPLFKQVYSDVLKKSPDAVRAEARWLTLRYLKSTKARRADLTKFMNRPEEVPDG